MPIDKVLHVCTVDATAHLLLGPQLRALRDAGYAVEVACRDGDHAEALRQEDFVVWAIPFAKKLFSIKHISACFALWRVIRRGRYNVVHVHNVITAVLGRVAAVLAGTPIVLYTAHGFYFHENMRPLVRWANVVLERVLGRFTDLLLSQSEEDRVTAVEERIVPAERAVTIGNGVDLGRFSDPTWCNPEWREKGKRDFGIPAGALVVGTVGRIVEEKGFREFFEAAAGIAEERADVVFMVVGDTLESDVGKFRGELLRLVEMAQLKGRFVFTGFRLDTERLYPLMDVFVLASYREGMPRTVIEAMASGIPVVATRIRGCREEVVEGETGLLVPVRDGVMLQRAVEQIIDRKELRVAMGEAATARARMLFDEANVCERVIKAYEGIVRAS